MLSAHALRGFHVSGKRRRFPVTLWKATCGSFQGIARNSREFPWKKFRAAKKWELSLVAIFLSSLVLAFFLVVLKSFQCISTITGLPDTHRIGK